MNRFPLTTAVLLGALLAASPPGQALADHFRVGISLNLGRPYYAPAPVYVAPVAPVVPYPVMEPRYDVLYQASTGQWYWYGRYRSARHADEVAATLRLSGWVAAVQAR